jgi:hypothetical protein
MCELRQRATVMEFDDDVAPTDKFAVDKHLREQWPS